MSPRGLVAEDGHDIIRVRTSGQSARPLIEWCFKPAVTTMGEGVAFNLTLEEVMDNLKNRSKARNKEKRAL